MIDKVVDWGDKVKKEHPITAPLVDKLIGEKEIPFVPCLSKGAVLEIPSSYNAVEKAPNQKWSVLSLNPSALFINQDKGKMYLGAAKRVSLLMETELRGDRPIVQLRNEEGETKYAIFGTYTDYEKKKRFSAVQLIDRAELNETAKNESKWSKKSNVIPISEINLLENSKEQSPELNAKINIVRDALNKADETGQVWKSMVFNGFGLMIVAEIGLGHFGLLSTFALSTATMLRFAQLSHKAFEIARKNIDSTVIRSNANLFIS